MKESVLRVTASAASDEHFQESLVTWFDQEGRRDLPWQTERTPYRVWVSEIMLQQTQVATVIPYFERFMHHCPDLPRLAAVSSEVVLSLWAGLGYYARARNLRQAARLIMERHGGSLPAEAAALQNLPGIGRSTAGAILSLGFGLRAPILDGNVKRVLCRYFGIRGWPGEAQIQRQLWSLSDRLTPQARVADYNQAMMDLGAMVCTRQKPACGRCPIQPHCAAHAEGSTHSIPAAKPDRPLPERRAFLLIVRDANGAVYLEKRPPIGVWGGLWSLPQFETEDGMHEWLRTRGFTPTRLELMPAERHTFSHFRLRYVPVLCQVPSPPDQVADAASSLWFRAVQDCAPGVPVPVRRVLERLGHGISQQHPGY